MRTEIIVKAVASVVFVLLGGVFSGLSLGLMGVSGRSSAVSPFTELIYLRQTGLDSMNLQGESLRSVAEFWQRA